MKTAILSMAAALTAAAATVTPVASLAASAHREFEGHVVHVSSENIKVSGVEGHKHQTLSFLIGHGTLMRHTVKPGEYVRVIFDQKFLGIRHADSVDPWKDPAMKIKS